MHAPALPADARKAFGTVNTAAACARVERHTLGNGFYAITTRSRSGDAHLGVYCGNGIPCANVLGYAIGMDIASETVPLSWLPAGMDVLERLRRLTCKGSERQLRPATH